MREVFYVLQVCAIFIWPVTVFAAQLSFGADIANSDLLGVCMTLILSSLSGLTALLAQMKNDYEANGKIDRLWLYATGKMFGSNLAGVIAFFLADMYKMTSASTAVFIIAASFGGTWLLERALASMVSKYLPAKEPQ